MDIGLYGVPISHDLQRSGGSIRQSDCGPATRSRPGSVGIDLPEPSTWMINKPSSLTI